MAEHGSDARTSRWFEPLLRDLPASVRYRLFNPAYEDLRLEHVLRVRRLRRYPGAARVCSALFAVRVLALIFGCYRGTPGFLLAHPLRGSLRGLRAVAAACRHMPTYDLRQAVRLLWKQPFFSGAAVLVLAVGIGASTVIFSVVNAVLLRPLPFPEADRLVALEETFEGRPQSVSPVNFYDWRREARSFSAMGIYTDTNMTLAVGDRALAVTGYAASSGFFPALGVRPTLGRWFSPEDDRAPGPRSVVLGHGLWRGAFAAAADVVGQQAWFDGTPYTVIGVAPEGVAFPEDAEAWFSLGLSDRALAAGARGAHYVSAIARLREGVTREAANAELETIANRLAAAYPRTNRDSSASATGLLDSIVGTARPALLLLLGGVACLLLIACVNVSGLLMARTASRRTEGAIRVALGAGRLALVRQVLMESLVLAAIAAAISSLVAAWGVGALMALVPSDLPRASAVGTDWRVIVFTAAVTLASGLGLGLVPAWQSTRAALAGSLQSVRHDCAAAGSAAWRGALIAAEVTLALVLLVAAGLTTRSFVQLTRVSPGFDPRGVLTFWVSLPEGVYREPSQVARFYQDLVARLTALPAVTSAGAVMIPPVSRSGFGGTFSIEGRDEDPADEPRAQLRPATPGYFRTLGARVLRGRGLQPTDGRDAPPVAVITETAARRYWPGEDPVGKRLRMHVSAVGTREPFREIVGVIQDVKTGRLQLPPAPVVYVPHEQHLSSVMSLMVRTAADPAALSLPVLAAVRAADKTLVAQDLMTLERHVARSRADQRFRAILLASFATAAFLLAIVGLYAVVVYSTGKRRHEIGVRVALGATRRDIVRLVVGEGIRPVGVGLVLGVGASFLLSRAISGLLFGVKAFDLPVVLGVSLLLGVASGLACYLPARRSAEVDPRESLGFGG